MVHLHQASTLALVGINILAACVNGSLGPPSSPFIIPETRGGGSTKALKRDDDYLSHSTSTSLPQDIITADDQSLEQPRTSLLGESYSSQDGDAADASTLFVKKKDGRLEPIDKQKILRRLQNLSEGLNLSFLSLPKLATSILLGTYPNVTTTEIDTLASETAASMSTQHPDYGRLAARICASANQKSTPNTFAEAMLFLNENGQGFVNNEIADLVKRRGDEINARIQDERDLELTYFGFKTLERSYLLKSDKETIVERPQYLWMRVALGIHCCKSLDESGDVFTAEEEDANLEAAFETYDLMSRGYFTHASPTLFHAGTTHPQLSSCFLVQMSDDSINGIYDTLKRCAVISKAAGGIGLCVHNIRARGTFIKGTRGVSNGLVPMLRVYDVTSHYVDQGGGKRPGAFAVYLEPWHADIFDVLNLKKNHGKEEQRARNLFYGLWVPDLFMKRVEENGMWSLMCPHQCPGLAQCHGEEFDELYSRYESEGRFTRQVRARELWAAILDAQIETGTPYLLYKDAANKKSNQQNLGTIQCSNLCTEIIQYTDEEEVAVCNLASICLAKFVVTERGRYGSTSPGKAYFDHEQLHKVAKIVTKNLDKVIDANLYPIDGAKKSNRSHRPVGIGVSGLADTFLRLGLPFASKEAKELNEAIFETIYHASLEASNENAMKKGSYKSFEGSPASKGKLQFSLWGMSDDETPSRRIWKDNRQTEVVNLQKYADGVSGVGYDWKGLRSNIIENGLRNSLLVAPMPTASTSQILGVNECFEPFASNLYVRRVKAGEFIIVNPHLIQDLTDLGLWNQNVRNQLMGDGGSVAKIDCIPDHLKELYKTVWEMKMKDIIDMAADRGAFIDQSQSLNLFISDPTTDKLTAMHFYAWKKGLKTGIYYLRTRPAVNAIQYTVEKNMDVEKAATSSPLDVNGPYVDDSEMPTEEERDYNELLRCYQNLQRQHRNVVKKHQASTQRIKKLSSKISTLKLRQEAKEKETNDRSCSNLVKEKKDAATTTTTSTKDNDDLQKTNQRLKIHFASQHDLDTLRLALQDEKLNKILKFHNEYKARHVALKEELHFLEIERNQLEEYNEEVSDLREQNKFLEEKVQELILQGVVNNQEGED